MTRDTFDPDAFRPAEWVIKQIMPADSMFAVGHSEGEAYFEPVAFLALCERAVSWDGSRETRVLGMIADYDRFTFAEELDGFEGYKGPRREPATEQPKATP